MVQEFEGRRRGGDIKSSRRRASRSCWSSLNVGSVELIPSHSRGYRARGGGGGGGGEEMKLPLKLRIRRSFLVP